MKLKDDNIEITETTRINVSFVNFFALLAFIVSGVLVLSTLKTEMEMRLSVVEEEIITEVLERKQADKTLKVATDKKFTEVEDEQKNINVLLIQNGIDMTEIKTDLKWLRALFEKKEK